MSSRRPTRSSRSSSVFWARVLQSARDHFVPHHGNAYVPHVLHHRVLFGYTIALLLLKLIVIIAAITLPSSSLYSSAITPQNIVTLTNQTRENLGLPSLRENPVLARAALAKAEDMMAKQYFAHVAPDGTTPWQWFKSVGYSYVHAAENLAAHFSEAEGVHGGWLASPTHKANIVSPKYTEIGVAVVRGHYEGYETTFVVEMFGTPKTDAAPVPVPPPPTLADTTSLAPSPEGFTLQTTDPVAPTEGVPATWEGVIVPSPIDGERQVVTVLATHADGTQTTIPVAIIAPATSTQRLYAFGDDERKAMRIFGVTISGLEDRVRQLYVATMVFLGGALLAALIVKFHARQHRIIAHALIVIVLAGFLSVM